MARTIAGVIVGYLAMFAGVFVTFSVFYLIVGTEGAFRPGSYEVTTLWIIGSFILGLLAAIVGGLVCLAIAREARAATVLAIFVIVLGAVMAIAAMGEQPNLGPRAGDVALLESMSKAIQPKWVTFLNPLVGAVGVLIAARMRPPRESG